VPKVKPWAEQAAIKKAIEEYGITDSPKQARLIAQ
jgi:hypothetical protein